MMTNYDKKRSRQNGRQGPYFMSDKEKIYLKGYYSKVGDKITKSIDEGILPQINYHPKVVYMKTMTKDEFIKDYPNVENEKDE